MGETGTRAGDTLAPALLAAVEERLRPLRVAQVVVGLAYTGVLLSDGRMGVAATLVEGQGCRAHPRAGGLSGLPAWELAQGLLSPDPVASSLGLATVNAALGGGKPSPDPVAALAVGRGDVVGLVGYIGPLVRALAGRAKELLVFERNQSRPEVLPDWAVELELPRCDVVFITGTAFANNTVDRLVALSRGRVAVIGPSTPMWPGLLERGVDWLFGARVLEPSRALTAIAEAGGTRALYRSGLVKVALGRDVDH
ncbi:TPA: hypothetical protein EYH33_03545 [Candidatus Bipolaricaulota bacterium]|nr:hypothetical protein [Candidatus Bipolaricaulota bacterium]